MLASRIDAGSAIQFKDQMRDLTVDVKGRVVLDMAQVDFVDSSGLGAIVAAMTTDGRISANRIQSLGTFGLIVVP